LKQAMRERKQDILNKARNEMVSKYNFSWKDREEIYAKIYGNNFINDQALLKHFILLTQQPDQVKEKKRAKTRKRSYRSEEKR